MDAGRITHFGSSEEVQLAGAELALAAKLAALEKLEEEADPKLESTPSIEEDTEGEEDDEPKEGKRTSAMWTGYSLVFRATGFWRSFVCISSILVLAVARVAVQIYVKGLFFPKPIEFNFC